MSKNPFEVEYDVGNFGPIKAKCYYCYSIENFIRTKPWLHATTFGRPHSKAKSQLLNAMKDVENTESKYGGKPFCVRLTNWNFMKSPFVWYFALHQLYCLIKVQFRNETYLTYSNIVLFGSLSMLGELGITKF